MVICCSVFQSQHKYKYFCVNTVWPNNHLGKTGALMYHVSLALVIKPHDRDTCRSGERSAMRAASQLPERGPTVVDMAPIPAR